MAPGIPAGAGQTHPPAVLKRALPQEQGCTSKVARRSNSDAVSEWDEEQHREFVAAVFEIGLRNSSPAVILENMTQKPKSITSERVKSKLQKYRKSKEKSKQEFLEEYDAFFQRAKAIDSAGGMPLGMSSTTSLLEVMGSTTLLGGDAAAFLSYVIKREQESGNPGEAAGATLSTKLLKKGAMDYVENFAGSAIPFPVLTEDEKKSSLGVSMSFVMGLFLSMTQHIMQERESAVAEASKSTPGKQDSTTSMATASNNGDPGFAMKIAASLAMENPNGGNVSNPTDDRKLGAVASDAKEAL